MSDWKQWQGRVVGAGLPLTEYLAGTNESGVFLSVTDSQKLAIKLVPADASADRRLEHWKADEALSHPHLLKIHQSGRTTIDGVELLYLAMEYADENLSQVVSQRALTNDEVRQMLPPILEALEFLHGKGLVHGGVKPGNIMAVGEQLKLASDDVMRTKEAVNVPGPYDAPEARQGVSAASDVWSLGVTLMEVLTQQRPASVEAIQKRAESLAEPFRGIVQNSVQVNPSIRWKIAEIRDYLDGRSRQATAKTPAVAVAKRESAPIQAKANTAISYGVPAVGLGIVLLGIAIAFLVPHHSKPEPKPEPSAAVTSGSSSAESSQPRPESKASKKEAASSPAPEPARTGAATGADGVVNRVLPDVPRRALRTINGKVRVKVRVDVDREGRVVGSKFTSAGPSRYFANLAMDAARQWKFTPSEEEARAWNLQFEFRRSGAEAVPTQIER